MRKVGCRRKLLRPDVKKMHHYLDLKELSHMIILDSLTDGKEKQFKNYSLHFLTL